MTRPLTYGFVFARGGSKGVPGKNLRPIGGEPLVSIAVRLGLAHPLIDRVFVSTDDPCIADAARAVGGEVPFLRPAELATDSVPERLAWRHAIREVCGGLVEGEAPCFDLFVSLPATCPLRAPEDVSAAIERYMRGGADTVITVTDPGAHPAFNMVTPVEGGLVRRYQELPGITRRQDAPPALELSAVCYVTSPAFVLGADSYFDGRVAAVHVPPERAVDIDTELDLAFAEFLFARAHHTPNTSDTPR
jgi:N-acylneuraminate cytidylyltransferase